MKNALTLSLLCAALLMACSPEKETDTTVATNIETTTTTTDNQDMGHGTTVDGGSVTLKSEHGMADQNGSVKTTTQHSLDQKRNSTATDSKMTDDQTQTITVVTSSNPEFSTLNQLIMDAGLTETLDNGEYTVFAPTNEAFAQVPAATLNALKKDKAKLRQVLMYHVVAKKVPASQVMKMTEALSLEAGQKLMIATQGNQLMIGNAKVLKTDVMASNGVVHVIDHVLIPKNLKM